MIDNIKMHGLTLLRDAHAPHEAGKLNLATDKAFHRLGWQPQWDFKTTVARTITWYKQAHEGQNIRSLVDSDLDAYCRS